VLATGVAGEHVGGVAEGHSGGNHARANNSDGPEMTRHNSIATFWEASCLLEVQ
jgi:hypothetical protein